MKIINDARLPEPLFAAVSRSRRPMPGTISVTELISPPQIRSLTIRHWDEIEELASERIWATMGQLMHTLLEEHGRESKDHLTEQTLSTEVEGLTVTGTFDLYSKDGVLSDYKFVSVWSTMDGVKREWEEQLNLYAELLRRTGRSVTRLEIVAIFRDWSKSRAQDSSYPQSQVSIFEVELWPSERASRFLTKRVRLHREAEAGASVVCSAEERWERPTKYALMKRGRKSAVKLFDSRDEASQAVTTGEHYIEERPGVSIRCDSYCRVSKFCPQRTLMQPPSDAESE